MAIEKGLRRRDLLSAGVLGGVASLAGCSSLLGDSSEVTEEWTTRVSRTTGHMAIRDGTVFVCTEFGLQTVDVETGDLGWEFSTGQNRATGRPVVEDGRVFFGTLAGRSTPASVYAVTTTGGEEWNVQLPSGATSSSIANGTVYVASGVMGGDHGLYAFDAETGAEQWTVPFEEHAVGSSPTVADGTVFLESGGFAAFDPQGGELNWRNERDHTEIGYSGRRAPAVGDGTVYFGYSLEPALHAFDVETGDERWRKLIEMHVDITKPVLDGETLYVGTTNRSPDHPRGRLYALDAESGDERWSAQTNDVPIEGPVVSDGTVYAAGGKTIYAIDGDSGETLWDYEFDNWISAPVVADERLIVSYWDPGSSDHVLHALRW